MKVYGEKNKIIVDGVVDFHLDHIFDCGQCFRWKKEKDGSYTGIAFGKVININYIDQKIILENSNLEDYYNIWKSYFDLDTDYGVIKKALSEKDKILEKAIAYGYGMRILQQDKWETIISFIISQNNNIPRIKKCIDSICVSYGNLVEELKGTKYYSFPGPEVLAELSENDLAAARLGYRTKYILETAKLIAGNDSNTLNKIGDSDCKEIQKYLLNLCGVGPKVANCIMLFSMSKYESFPIDVWVRRVMNQMYFIDENDTKAMMAYAEDKFCGYGGIAQQYLFYYIRNLKNERTKEGNLKC